MQSRLRRCSHPEVVPTRESIASARSSSPSSARRIAVPSLLPTAMQTVPLLSRCSSTSAGQPSRSFGWPNGRSAAGQQSKNQPGNGQSQDRQPNGEITHVRPAACPGCSCFPDDCTLLGDHTALPVRSAAHLNLFWQRCPHRAACGRCAPTAATSRPSLTRPPTFFFRLVIQRKKRTTGLSRFASKTASG
jgi:hypothetical protein